MPPVRPLSILPLRPPAAVGTGTPATLTQVTQMLAQTDRGPMLGNADLGDDALNGPVLLDRLASWSAHRRATHFLFRHQTSPRRLLDLVRHLARRPTDMRLAISCRLDAPLPSGTGQLPKNTGIVLVQWHPTGPLPDIGLFKAVSMTGIWNHLVLDGAAVTAENCKLAADHPNIIHSWEISGTAPADHRPLTAYGRVQPLLGRPLWHFVTDPADRFMLVDRMGALRLMRVWVDENGEDLYTLGERLDYHFSAPGDLPDGYLDEICAMVAAGGTVANTHVRANLQRAHLIGYVQEKGRIVGNSSLKNPRPAYIDSVRRLTGLDLSGYVERGYTSVRPEYRGLGIGTKLLDGLTRRVGNRKIFSVIAEDNAATQTIAIRNRTRKVATYFSDKAGKPVGIWMPEWMIDTADPK